ncbi:mannitol-1-phosphate 5-dehydrogenase, partial [Peribacillus frigoritolerans]|nr:mannitol-1-phosphate 5-dehydrogenase [Peribacillus frigoritolerans]
AKAIAAALLFDFNEDEEALKLQTMIKEHGVASALKEVSGLDESNEITKEVVNHYNALKK